MRRVVTILVGLALLGQSAASWAASDSEDSTGAQIGYGTASVVGSAVYFPFKAAFCILGAIGSGPDAERPLDCHPRPRFAPRLDADTLPRGRTAACAGRARPKPLRPLAGRPAGREGGSKRAWPQASRRHPER